MTVEIEQFLIGADNFGVLIHNSETGATATVDAGEAAPIIAALQRRGWRLTDILVTHHHGDHIAGLSALKAETGARVVAAKADAHRIPDIDLAVSEGDQVQVGNLVFDVYETPGHTIGHIAYHSADARLLFAGDTLFSLGCGRLFEGTAAMMWSSLQKLRALPDETLLYCGHEYTLSNARFALRVDPDNSELKRRASEVESLRSKAHFTLPVSLGSEKRTNVFLRADDEVLQDVLGMKGHAAVDVFAALRAAKDKA
jgi:hydroxyacylglutathione hydrolase